MSEDDCGLCGRRPAAGVAFIGDVRYCHGDDYRVDASGLTCYMQAQGGSSPSVVEDDPDLEDPCQALRARVEAITRWLLDDGHLTPTGARQIRAILEAETP